jgi:hypothetical protein
MKTTCVTEISFYGPELEIWELEVGFLAGEPLNFLVPIEQEELAAQGLGVLRQAMQAAWGVSEEASVTHVGTVNPIGGGFALLRVTVETLGLAPIKALSTIHKSVQVRAMFINYDRQLVGSWNNDDEREELYDFAELDSYEASRAMLPYDLDRYFRVSELVLMREALLEVTEPVKVSN